MRLLTYQARRFAWQSFQQTLAEGAEAGGDDELSECAVAWLHVEARDEADHARVFKRVLKHLKWVANKRALRNVALHSFAHLGGESAGPDYAHRFITELAERLRDTGYTVKATPFGWFCGWQLDCYGDSLAKIYKEF